MYYTCITGTSIFRSIKSVGAAVGPMEGWRLTELGDDVGVFVTLYIALLAVFAKRPLPDEALFMLTSRYMSIC